MLWQITGIFALCALIASVDITTLFKEKRKKDMLAVFMILGIGMAMNMATILKMNIPSPLNWIRAIFEPFDKMILNILS